ncbi:hypothetical protein BT69DRAFT_1241845, partial [Atractiella rhizophila]
MSSNGSSDFSLLPPPPQTRTHALTPTLKFNVPAELFIEFSDVAATFVVPEDAGNDLLVLSLFLAFLLQSQNINLQIVYQALSHPLLHAPHVHAAAAKLDKEEGVQLLRTYFKARTLLHAKGDFAGRMPDVKEVGVFKREDVGLWAVFGGQGCNDTYWSELVELWTSYEPFVSPFLSLASNHLAQLSSTASPLFHPRPLSPLSWLKSSTQPDAAYLRSVPVSMPLLAVIQYVRYIALGMAMYLGPAEMQAHFSSTTGHSQGVVPAVVIARRYEALEKSSPQVRTVSSSNSSGDSTDEAVPTLKELEKAWSPFYQVVIESLSLLFSLSLRGSLHFPPSALPPSLLNATEEPPTPMLSINGLSEAEVSAFVKRHNAALGEEETEKVEVSLKNGARNFVVTGSVRGLVGFLGGVKNERAEEGKDENKVAFSKRKKNFNTRFLPIELPFHSRLLDGVQKECLEDLKELKWEREDLAIEVRNTETGRDMRQGSENGEGLVEELLLLILRRPINFQTVCAFPPSTTHAVDFGPGGKMGVGSLLKRNSEGTGVRVMLFEGVSSEFWNSEGSVRFEDRWEDRWRARLVKSRDGRVHIDTPFSRLVKKPPLMVAGMTPTTVQAGFNAAVLNAGYHVELAGGGHYSPAALRKKVDDIVKMVKPGLAITLNSLYINPKQWAFQFPLWCQMKQEGLPVEGLCVAAGIPSTEKAKEIIDALSSAGIKHVSFKPGSVDGIRQVISIAAANPDFPIILQWTGGRAGGHHSYEDFFQPMLQTYADIRAKKNIVLVAGSGFGAAEDTWEFLTGEWARRFGAQDMPYDGFLFASRVMVAKEAHTSESVKKLIVEAKGVDDAEWEGTYTKETGGIITVNSELGEPIHKVANRALKLWKEFDTTVFALPKEKRVQWLKEKKDYVIQRLNADFQKPWFGETRDGKPCDVEDMEYETVTRRMVRLCYVSHEKRWIDVTLRNLVGDWLRRVEERMSPVNGKQAKVSALQSFDQLNKPFDFLDDFFNNRYPAAKEQILASEDVAYFLAICQRPGQKPVPFIPILDANFGVWFKKDSLWQAEDIEAVFDQDPQRVAILQGPVAAKWSTRTDEPVGEILGNVEKGLISRLLERYYDNDESKIPVVDYFGEPLASSEEEERESAPSGVKHSVEELADGTECHTYELSKSLPPTGEWLDTLAGSHPSWLRALLTNLSIVQDKAIVDNPLLRVMSPREDQVVKVTVKKDGRPVKVEVYGGERN